MKRAVEIAKVLRRFLWMVEVMRQRSMSLLHPYMVEVYVARDGVGGVPLPRSAEGFLHAGRSREGGATGAGLQPVRDVRRQDKGGAQTKGVAGIHHCGERIREGAPTRQTKHRF